MTFPDRIQVPEEVLTIVRTLEDAGYESWCVGGAVRDALLDQADERGDYDIATAAGPDRVQELFKHTVAVGLRYGTVGVLDRHRDLHEVTTFRRDVNTFGRHAEVEFGVSLDDDLARRDFTINAIAYHPLRHEWRDRFAGAEDLDRKVLKAVGDPAERFREDYLRILRGIRFTARLGFTMDSPTWDAAIEEIDGLQGLSAERVREEWFKGLMTAQSVSRLVSLWNRIGAAPIWIPELLGPDDVDLEETNLDAASRDPVVLTTILCLDPVAVLQRLKASNQEIGRAASMVSGPPTPDGADALATRRWLAAVGDVSDDLRLLWQIRHGSSWPWETLVGEIRERGDPLTRADLVIDGDDLVNIGMEPGPAIGEALERLVTAVVDEPALNTKEQLLGLARVRSE